MSWTPGDAYRIALFYRYVQIFDVEAVVSSIRTACEQRGLLGRVLVSGEGINGTLAGSVSVVEEFVKYLALDRRFQHIDWKFTDDKGDELPFLGLSVREVDEIISSGRAKSFIDSNIKFSSDAYGGIVGTGTHLTPQEFHAAIAKQDGVILDIRNEFEFDIGHFQGSTNLKTFNYAETFDVLDEIVPSPEAKATSQETEQNIYMYCTGGIRCEKASAYLCAKGFKNVYQLEGGIHRYLEAFPDGGLFQGKNFVFDSRVAVGPSSTATVDTGTGTTNSAHGTSSEDSSAANAGDAVIGSGTGGGAAVVVGKCIDCAAPHDQYSGHIVCTVCRMPVLVCPKCVESNPVPGEYHCSRHRDLKELYFTVLTRFSREQLQQQLRGLQRLEAESAAHLEKVRARERVERRLAMRAQHRRDAPLPADGSSTGAAKVDSAQHEGSSVSPEGDNIDTVAAGAVATISGEAHLSKQRRRTLRKQIDRITALLRQPGPGAEIETEAEHGSQANVDLAGMSNPKTRGGWGFWKS